MAEPSLLQIVGLGPDGWGAQFAAGTAMTMAISVGAYAVGILFGLAECGARVSTSRPVRRVAVGYTTIVRAIPELLLIIPLFYSRCAALDWRWAAVGLGGRVGVSGFVTAMLTLGFVQGAYMTEVFRGALSAVPAGWAARCTSPTWR